MQYSSNNGYFHYYDRSLYNWMTASPSMLFLLGLEAITTYSNSLSDALNITKYKYVASTSELYELDYIYEIYDEIYAFLSQIGSVEDLESYIKFNCYGLKLSINDLTGTGDDRTVPVIFKNDTNKSLADPTKYVYGLSDNDRLGMSYYDIQSILITNIFKYANFTNYHGKYESLYDKFYSRYHDDNKNYIELYYNQLRSYDVIGLRDYNYKAEYSDTFKLLDYAAMYSYSLGVLYGCRCLGFSDNVIWRFNPIYWYNGRYRNLVRTAWYVFRAHWCDVIDKNVDETAAYWASSNAEVDTELNNKYLPIRQNRFWNYNNNSAAPLIQHEQDSFIVSVSKNDSNDYVLNNEHIIFAYDYEDHSEGSYLKIESQEGSNQVYSWRDISEKLTTDPLKGVADKNNYIIRYAGDSKLIFYSPKSFKTDDIHTLLPGICNSDYYKVDQNGNLTNFDKCYFVLTDNTDKYNVGWCKYIETNIIDYINSDSNIYDPHKKLSLQQEVISQQYVSNDARLYTKDGSYAHYVKFDLLNELPSGGNTSDDTSESYSKYIYGILNSYTSGSTVSHFDRIISQAEFENEYLTITHGYYYKLQSNSVWYDLDNRVSFLILESQYNDSTVINKDTNIYVGDIGPHSIEWFGYSENKPSIECKLYKDVDGSLDDYTFRYYTDNYWSSDYSDNGIFESRKWYNGIIPPGLYSKESTLSLYKGSTLIPKSLYSDGVYLNTIVRDNSSTEYAYIVNTPESSTVFGGIGFIPLGNIDNDNSLYAKGITPYPCHIISVDDDGNSFQGKVWYDDKTGLHWNGLFGINKWQHEKPTVSVVTVYNASTGESKYAMNSQSTNTIEFIDGGSMTYSEFYGTHIHGIVSGTKLSVFNAQVSNDILECYVDYSDNEYHSAPTYCVHDEMNEWKNLASLNSAGYRFVDGVVTLYNGNDTCQVVYDSNNED